MYQRYRQTTDRRNGDSIWQTWTRVSRSLKTTREWYFTTLPMTLGDTWFCCTCGSLVLNFRSTLVLRSASQMCMIGSDLQRHTVGARSASPRVRAEFVNPPNHPEVIRIPHAKFGANLLKTVAWPCMKNKVTDTETDRQTHTHTCTHTQISFIYSVSQRSSNLSTLFNFVKS